MRYLSKQEVESKLTMETCISLMRELFGEIARGKVPGQLRTAMPISPGKLLGLMPGSLPYKDAVGAKLITVYHENYRYGLPSHQGVVVLFDSETGSLRGMVDGTAITGIRTAAASAVATDLLAREEAKRIALLGAGVQAKAHLEAIAQVRSLERAYVWSHDLEEAESFAGEQAVRYDFPITVCQSAKEAVESADIICTVTSSETPILEGLWLPEGVHINAVGACRPKDRELDSLAVKEARLFGDSLESVQNESGDYLIPLAEGIIDEMHLLGEIGDVLVGHIAGRQSDQDITLFKSLGIAAEDIACAAWLLENTERGE